MSCSSLDVFIEEKERRSRKLAVRVSGTLCIWAGKTVTEAIEAITAHDVREAEGRPSHDIPAVLKDVSQAERLTPCSAPAQLRQRYTRQLNSSQYISTSTHQHAVLYIKRRVAEAICAVVAGAT